MTAIPDTMLAAVRRRYGPPEVVETVRVPVPSPRKGEVLIRVRAASVNASDWENLVGSPAYARIFGLTRPRFPILGSDVAGEVVAVGDGVTRFAPGDAVVGDTMGTFGTFAEYVCAPQGVLVPKPEGLSFEVAATLPQAGAIAIQGIEEPLMERAAARVLINGAGGGSGCFGIQFAKRAGAEVTAVDRGEKFNLMRRMGADHLIDYTTDDFAERGESYGLVLDLVATRSVLRVARCVAPGGRYFLVGGRMSALLGTLTLGPLLGIPSGRKIGVLAAPFRREDLTRMCSLAVAGELHVNVERTVGLEEVREALRYHGEGRTLGKIVVSP